MTKPLSFRLKVYGAIVGSIIAAGVAVHHHFDHRIAELQAQSLVLKRETADIKAKIFIQKKKNDDLKPSQNLGKEKSALSANLLQALQKIENSRKTIDEEIKKIEEEDEIVAEARKALEISKSRVNYTIRVIRSVGEYITKEKADYAKIEEEAKELIENKDYNDFTKDEYPKKYRELADTFYRFRGPKEFGVVQRLVNKMVICNTRIDQLENHILQNPAIQKVMQLEDKSVAEMQLAIHQSEEAIASLREYLVYLELAKNKIRELEAYIEANAPE